MSPPPSILTDDADLAVELAQVAERMHVPLAPRVSATPFEETGDVDALLLLDPPAPLRLLSLVERPSPPLLAFIGASSVDLVGLGHDVGLPVFTETRPLVAAVRMRALNTAALEASGLGAPAWGAQSRGLPRAMRVRLERHGWSVDRKGGKLVALDGGLVGWRADDEPIDAQSDSSSYPLGDALDVALAGASIRASLGGDIPWRGSVEGIDQRAVREVLFGPARALSDPASKSALLPYGVPIPTEELCSSPSRAAAEAARIGFPVKVSLASPDLRLWDHPDLEVLYANSAAAVRDGFRLVTTMAAERDPDARLLGVYVTAESAAWLRLRLVVHAATKDWALGEIGRSDDPSRATLAALPTTSERLKHVLGRLGVTAPRGPRSLDDLVEALNRLAVFVVEQKDAVTRLEINPLAALVGGGVEVREACVHVSDLFERSLDLG